MQPQTYREIAIQHAVNSLIKLSSELKPDDDSGIILMDIDDTIEAVKTPRYIDLFMGGLGEINRDFKSKLSIIQQDISSMYKKVVIDEPMTRISYNFRVSGVTRGQVKEASRWAFDNYQVNPGLEGFVKEDLPLIGIKPGINTGHFDYPVELLVRKLDIPARIVNYSRILYSNDSDEGVVVRIFPNVLWNKQAVNEIEAQKLGISQHMVISMAESPEFEPFFPIYSGLAIWVDQNASKFPVQSRINLYMPEARTDMRKLTPRLANWRITAIDLLFESALVVRQNVETISEIKRNVADLESPNPAEVNKAISAIAEESKVLIHRVRRHNPSVAEAMERYIYILSGENKIETQKLYVDMLIKIIESSFVEWYKTEEMMKQLDMMRKIGSE